MGSITALDLPAHAAWALALARSPRRALRALRDRRADPARFLRPGPVPGEALGRPPRARVLFTTDEGLFEYDPARGCRRLLAGHCYGLTRSADTWIVTRTDRTDHASLHDVADRRLRTTHLFAFELGAAGACSARSVLWGIPGEVHQIDVVGDRLCFPFVAGDLLLSAPLRGLLAGPAPRSPLALRPARIGAPGCTHVNSLFFDRAAARLWLVAHNDSKSTGRTSELLREAEPGRFERIPTPATSAHNVYAAGEDWVMLDSGGGRVLSNRGELHSCGRWLRGLCVGPDFLLIGASDVEPERLLRHTSDTELVELQLDGAVAGSIRFRGIGPINEIRRVDGADAAMSMG